MAVTDYTNALRGRLDAVDPNTLADMLRSMGFGAMVRAERTFRRNLFMDGGAAGGTAGVAGTNKYVIATAHSVTLGDDAKGLVIQHAYARGGTGTKGELTVDAGFANTAPAAGHCAVSPNGDLIFNAGDAWTIVDLEYFPQKYDIVELTLPVASNTVTLPTSVTNKGVLFMLEAESLVGTLVSKLIVQIPTDGAPATGNANLKLAKAAVNFAVADAVTQCRVKLAVASAIDVDALLEGAATVGL